MPKSLQRTIYTAHATVTGGRNGHGATDDGALDVQLGSPKESGGPGGGTNPEQLFAVGLCRLLPECTGWRRAPGEGGCVGGQDRRRRLVEAAHQVCPYSNATRGNIEVTLSEHTPETAAA